MLRKCPGSILSIQADVLSYYSTTNHGSTTTIIDRILPIFPTKGFADAMATTTLTSCCCFISKHSSVVVYLFKADPVQLLHYANPFFRCPDFVFLNLIIWSNEFHAGINFEFLDSNLDEMCELKYPSEASLVSPEAPKSQYFFILIFMPKCRDFFPFKIVTLYAFWAFWL